MRFRLKRLVLYFLFAGAAGVAAYVFLAGGERTPQYQTARAEVRDLVETVSETGAVKAARELSLSFRNPGTVAAVLVSVGQTVAADAPLMSLDIAALELERTRQEAAVKMAENELQKLRTGASVSDVRVSQAAADQAKTAYDNSLAELDRTRNSAAESIRQAEKRVSDLRSAGAGDQTSEEQAVATARITLDNAKATNEQAIAQKIDSSQAVMEAELADAAAALDRINTILNDSDARYNLSVNDPVYKDLAADGRTAAIRLITDARAALDDSKIADGRNETEAAESLVLLALDKTFYALDNCYKALENSVVNGAFTQTDLDAFKAAISGHITTVTAGTSAVKAAKQALSSAVLAYDTALSGYQAALDAAIAALEQARLNADNALATAKLAADRDLTAADSRAKSAYQAWQVALSQLQKTKAPARAEDIAIADARLRDARAALDSVGTRLKDSAITSPIAGTVTRVEYEAGEQAIAGQPAVMILGENDYEIEVLVSEADITKVGVGDPADITLDAYGDDVHFKGQVAFIEPAETVIQEVVYYKVKAVFESSGREVKSGMTANVIVTTDRRTGALTVPARAVIQKNGSGKFVRVVKDGVAAEAPVKTGLRGDDGEVEILEGLRAGDEVVLSVIEK